MRTAIARERGASGPDGDQCVADARDAGAHWARVDSLSLNAAASGARRAWAVGAHGRIVTITPGSTARLLLYPR